LAVIPLEVSPDEEIEFLVGSPQFYIRPEKHGVVSLDERV